MNTPIQPHNERARAIWNAPAGRYDEISRTIADAIEHAVERLQAKPGERVLDLATGTGWASRSVAHRCPGAAVTGVDIADQMLDFARAAASRQDLAIQYQIGDAERLPFRDGEMDAVISTFGVMFASKPEVAASELARVVKPGGRVVLSTWKDDSNVAAMFGVMKPFLPPPASPPPPSPFAWGKIERLRELFGDAFEVGVEDGTNHFRYSSGERAWDLWVNHYGPTKSLAQSLNDERRAEFNARYTAVLESVDAIASPAGGDPAWPITHEIQVGPLPQYHEAWSRAAPRSSEFTMPMDLAGTPAICLPSGFSEDDLPYSIQFAGRRLGEPMLCRIAYAYERSTAWHLRHPADAGTVGRLSRGGR